MSERGVSTLVAMILVLAIVSTSIAAIGSHYLPVLKKRAEILQEERLTSSFLEIASMYPGNGTAVLELGGGTTILNSVQTTSSIHLWSSGDVAVKVSAQNVSDVSYNTKLFALNLSTFSTRIPDRTTLFSEGGVRIYQYGKNITRKPPDVIHSNAGLIRIFLDNLISGEQEVAGNSIAYITIHSNSRIYSFTNVNVTVTVNDAIFKDYWIDAMKNAGFRVISTGNTATGSKTNVNLTLEIRDFDVRLY